MSETDDGDCPGSADEQSSWKDGALAPATKHTLQIAPPVGGLAWYRQGGPRLRTGEVGALLGGAGLLTLKDVFARLTQLLRGRPDYVDLSVPALGETPASRAAAVWAQEHLTRDIYDHSQRTVLFATVEWLLSGGREGRWGDLDLDVLRIAGLFHDATLNEAAVEGHGCFTVGSAALAAKFAKEHGLSADAIEQIVTAITANPSTRLREGTHGTAAVVLSAGGLDEMLSRLYRMSSRNAAEIAEAHPWDGWAVRVRDHMELQRQEYPGSRFAYTGPLLNVLMRVSARNRV